MNQHHHPSADTDPTSSAAGSTCKPQRIGQWARSGQSRIHRSPVCSLLALFLLLSILVGCPSGDKKAPPTKNRNNPTPTGESLEKSLEPILNEMSQALALTENADCDAAIPIWEKLVRQRPTDVPTSLNCALAHVFGVELLTATANNNSESQENRKAARAQLSNAIAQARTAITRYAELSDDSLTKQWLQGLIEQREAELLPPPLNESIRDETFKKLTQFVFDSADNTPSVRILGGTLQDLNALMSRGEGMSDSELKRSFEAWQRLSDQDPDNVFLAKEAMQHAIETESPAAKELVQRVASLTKAIEPTLVKVLRPTGLTPDQFPAQLGELIDAKDWNKTYDLSSKWTNPMGPSELLKLDYRRAAPHPLDRLDFRSVRELATEVAKKKDLKASTATIKFTETTVHKNAKLTTAIDFNLDLQTDLVAIGNDNALHLLRNDKENNWTDVAQLELEVSPAGMRAVDLFMVDGSNPLRLEVNSSRMKRHDTIQSVLLFGDFGIRFVQLDGRAEPGPAGVLSLIDTETGLEELANVIDVVSGDMDGDGDLDLVAALKSGEMKVLVNRGNRTFFEAPVGSVSVDADDPIACMTIGDLDRDLDLDVLTLHAKSGRIGILENLLHLQTRHRYVDQVPAIDVSKQNGTTNGMFLSIEDVDGNIGWDIVASSAAESLVAFANSSDVGVWSVDHVETGEGFSSASIARPVLGDFDNDSYLEWLGPENAYRLGPWGIQATDQTTIAALADAIPPTDIDGDGLLDLAGMANGVLFTNTNATETEDHYLTFRFKGIADNGKNSGRVNQYAIGSTLELRFGSHYRSKVIRTPATHFGIDGAESVDSIRIIMPNGFTQSVIKPAIDLVVEEEQALKGSCPYLYTWDGETFAFQTDCLWAAPLGLQVAAGVVQKDRPWEYLLIDGSKVASNANGEYEFRLTEELWEVAYVDHVKVTAIDHPADVTVLTNEKVGPPSIAQQRVFAYRDDQLFQPQSAVGTKGDDITDLLSQNDGQFVKGFDYRIRQGLCPPHWIDVDFGDSVAQALANDPDADVTMILRGWILPTDTSLNIQIDQNPELSAIEFPSVWVPDANSEGGWKQVIPFMGFPGGKTKDIVVNLTEYLDPQDPRIRVRTSAQIYWDSAQLAIQDKTAVPETHAHDLTMTAAEVAYHGFSARMEASGNGPAVYDYSQPKQRPKWPPLKGFVSDFGPALDPLQQWDDDMLVISGGDEIRMTFSVPNDPVPQGWKRDFIFHCVGWDKDADLNTLTGQSIGPLPSRHMPAYPPTADTREIFDAVQEKNQPRLNRRQNFREFWYRPGR